MWKMTYQKVKGTFERYKKSKPKSFLKNLDEGRVKFQ
jgi:hypothetical protein